METQVDAIPLSKKKTMGLGKVILLIIIFLIIYNSLGFFTIQPIGAIPDGLTLVVLRFGTQLKFFDSADAMCKRELGEVSLLCRMAALGALGDNEEKILLRLPYIELFYLLSTGFMEYEN